MTDEKYTRICKHGKRYQKKKKNECDFYEFVGCKDCLYYMHDARAGRNACVFESITGNPPYEWKVKSAASKEEDK